MRIRRPIIYLAIAVVAALVILALENPFAPRVNDSADEYFIPDYDSADVMRLGVKQLINGAELKRDGDEWVVAERTTALKKQLLESEGRDVPPTVWEKADKLRVMSALGSFGGLLEGVLVSRNAGKQTLYNTGPAGLHVTGFDGDDKIIFDVIIGKNGPDFASSYIRRANEDNVYLVRRSLMGIFSPSAEDWEEKKKAE